MKGVSFLTDEKNNKIAVQIDLKKNGELWEDFYDAMVAYSRRREKTISLDTLKKKLKASGKL
jgi:hypothetical protein